VIVVQSDDHTKESHQEAPMRVASCLCLLFFFAAISSAQDTNTQDTNFPAGPQYLMNYGSPLFFHPIETPTLSLVTPPAVTPSAPAEEHSGEPDTPAFGELQTQAQIDWIYWGVSDHTESGQTSALSNVSRQSKEQGAQGARKPSEVELFGPQPSQPLAASILGAAATSVTDARSLRERGYGISLGEYAALVRGHERHATHVYTNADIARLHGS
jgi:hypothetical protein